MSWFRRAGYQARYDWDGGCYVEDDPPKAKPMHFAYALIHALLILCGVALVLFVALVVGIGLYAHYHPDWNPFL